MASLRKSYGNKICFRALQIVHHVMQYSQQHGDKELDQSLMRVTEKLLDI